MMGFDATALYLAAMYDENSVYPKKKPDLLLNRIKLMYM